MDRPRVYDSDADGDLSFIEPCGETTLSTLVASLQARFDRLVELNVLEQL